MTTVFDTTVSDPIADRFTAELENALLAISLAELGTLPDERVRALLSTVYRGWFNAAAFSVPHEIGAYGRIEWEPEGNGHRLVWYAPAGLACPLARVYPQADGSWAALVVAGVKDDAIEALAQAEWAVSRLTS